MKITFKSKAWVSEYNRSTPQELQTPEGAASLYYSPVALIDGCTFAGDAVITVDLLGQNDLVANKIDALRHQAASIRAEATVKCTRIEGHIQQLLSIEHSTKEKP